MRLFFGKGACSKCHMVRGEGGVLGPDLSSVGSRRNPEHLRRSILKPSEGISPEYWSVEAVANDGAQFSGIRLNEDSYSIQIIDRNETLRSLYKKDLRLLNIDKTKSWMPAYAGGFSEPELDDLVAYLYSLERK